MRLVFVFGLWDDRFVRTVVLPKKAVLPKKHVSPHDLNQSLERR